MDELTCVGCGVLLVYPDPEVLIAKMAEHFEECGPARELLRQSEMSDVAEMVAEENAVDVAGHLLCLSQPIMRKDEETGEIEMEGMSSVFFGPFETRQDAKAAGDRYLLGVAGLNCGDPDCQYEHAHNVSVLSYHSVGALDEFIADEQARYAHQAEHRAKGETCCEECHEEDEEAG
jgi:hypothetical protein